MRCENKPVAFRDSEYPGESDREPLCTNATVIAIRWQDQGELIIPSAGRRCCGADSGIRTSIRRGKTT